MFAFDVLANASIRSFAFWAHGRGQCNPGIDTRHLCQITQWPSVPYYCTAANFSDGTGVTPCSFDWASPKSYAKRAAGRALHRDTDVVPVDYAANPGGGVNGPVTSARFAAAASSAGSPQRRPTTCTPIGSPSCERASGSTTTGLPDRLNGEV